MFHRTCEMMMAALTEAGTPLATQLDADMHVAFCQHLLQHAQAQKQHELEQQALYLQQYGVGEPVLPYEPAQHWA
jgi:hypothetical protein